MNVGALMRSLWKSVDLLNVNCFKRQWLCKEDTYTLTQWSLSFFCTWDLTIFKGKKWHRPLCDNCARHTQLKIAFYCSWERELMIKLWFTNLAFAPLRQNCQIANLQKRACFAAAVDGALALWTFVVDHKSWYFRCCWIAARCWRNRHLLLWKLTNRKRETDL